MTLSADGFARPRLAEIKADYDKRFIDALGPVNTLPDSVVGQLIGIFSAALDDAYEALQNTYDAMYPYSAEGTSLDGAVAFVGLERLPAAPTSVVAMCYGDESTLVPAGVLARSLDNKQYSTSADVVISRSAAGDVTVEVMTVTNLAVYQITLNGDALFYTSDASATAEEIAAGIAAEVDPMFFTVTVEAGTFSITAIDLYSDFSISVDAKLAITRLGTPAVFTALANGAHALPAGALTRIDSSIAGWQELANLTAGSTGRDTETDEELRARHATSTRVTGSATAAAIKARLLAEVANVTAVQIYENRTSTYDGLVPPHSFEAVVQGGLDQAICDKLFYVKPAGIETYGNVSLTVIDPNGDGQTCSFSRPDTVYAWVRVTVTELESEESLTVAAATAIQEAVLEYGQTFSVGTDLNVQRFYSPIFKNTTGIASITVELDITPNPGDTPIYGSANIEIGRSEIAEFSMDRITVIGV